MTYSTAIIAQLVRWDGNPRPPATPAARNELKASIADKGVITPLIVRHKSGPKSGTKCIYEVIGGDTRREIITELLAEKLWEDDREIPIIVRDDLVGDDAAAMDVALSNNIHVPMHPMDQFYAFNQMVEMGREIKEIANAYGVSIRVVEQRLSYAKLDEKARQLVKSDQRDLEWAAAMTLASPDEQAEMLKEIENNPKTYSTGHDVKRHLDDALVTIDHALFDAAQVQDALLRKDLFDPKGASYMKRSEFEPLQKAALETLIADRKAEGWARVSVVSERDFDRYRYNDGVADKELAEVIFVRYESGAIVEHAGLTLRHEERLNHVDNEEDEVAGEAMFGGTVEEAREASAVTRAEVNRDPRIVQGKKTARYIDVSRAVITQAALMQDPRLTIAVTVAGLIMNAAPKPLEGRIFGDMTEIDPANPARAIVERRLDAARQIMEEGNIDPSVDYGEMISRLLELDDAQLMTLLQTAIAKRITSGMSRGDMLYETIMAQDGAMLDTFWRPDRTYLATLSKESLLALARQILPDRLQSKITGDKDDIIETLAQIIDDAHEGGMRLGEGERQIVTAWAPHSLGGQPADEPVFGASDESDDESGEKIFAETA